MICGRVARSAATGAVCCIRTDPSALSDFREPLSPYGTWVEDPTYGTVWVPSAVVVGADFAPYQTAGHWELSADHDWIWVSDYEWGYVPVHYGRWGWIAGRGWASIFGRNLRRQPKQRANRAIPRLGAPVANRRHCCRNQ